MSDLTKSELILDVRPESAFLAYHREGAVNIPLEALTDRIHELPHPEMRLSVYDDREVRAKWARSRLRARGRTCVNVVSGEAWLRSERVVSGPSRDRLWRPHALLEEALDCARRLWGRLTGRTALDVACGSGRDAVFLALAGFTEVEAWDVLPDALQRCEGTARRCGVTVQTKCRDVEREPAVPIDGYDLICCFNYLHRPLMPAIAAGVRPGGLVVYETFVEKQRELFGKPRRDAFLLKSGELPGYFDGWDVLVFREGLTGPRRFAASLVAQRR